MLHDLGVLLLEMADTVGLGGEAHVALGADEGLFAAAAVRAKVMLKRPEELEVHVAVFADGVGGVERVFRDGVLADVLVVTDRLIDGDLVDLAVLLPEMHEYFNT